MYSFTRCILARRLTQTYGPIEGVRENRRRWLQGETRSRVTQISSELVHLRGRRGHPTRARAEVGVDRNGAADGEDTTQAVTVMGDAVTHLKNLVRRDRIAGGIEGTSGQSAPGRG